MTSLAPASSRQVSSGSGVGGLLMLWCSMALAAAFLLPNHYPPWLAYHSELTAAIAFLPIIAWSLWRRAPAPAIAVGAMGFALVPVVQILGGQIVFSGDGWLSWLYLSGLSLAVLAGHHWTRFGHHTGPPLAGLEPLWGAFIVAGYLSTFLALHQSLELAPMGIYTVDVLPGARAYANLAQPNQLATLLLLAIAAHMALFETERLRASVALMGVLFLLCGVVLTGSRSVLLALLWLWPGYWLMRRRCRLRSSPAALLLLSAFFAAATVTWPSLTNILMLASDATTALERLDSAGVRIIYWQSMLDAIGRAPLLGYGWAQIGIAQTETSLDYPATHSYFYSSHNVLLDLLLWNGVPLGLAIITGLATWFVRQVRRCRDPVAWCALLAVGFVANHAMVEYPLSYAYFLLPVGFFMGAISVEGGPSADVTHGQLRLLLARAIFPILGLMTVAVLAKIAWEYPFWEQDWRDLRYQEARIGDPERDALPKFILLTQLDAVMKFSRSDARPAMSASELEWMRQVSARFGHSSGMFRYALALALNDRPVEASQALRRLCQMQSMKTCELARSSWLELTSGKYGQLAQVPFPPGTIGVAGKIQPRS